MRVFVNVPHAQRVVVCRSVSQFIVSEPKHNLAFYRWTQTFHDTIIPYNNTNATKCHFRINFTSYLSPTTVPTFWATYLSTNQISPCAHISCRYALCLIFLWIVDFVVAPITSCECWRFYVFLYMSLSLLLELYASLHTSPNGTPYNVTGRTEFYLVKSHETKWLTPGS